MIDQRAVLLSSKEESPGSKRFVFETQEQISYTAGQFLRLTLSSIANDPRGPSRFFSIASSPTEQNIFIATTISQSPFKQMLTSLPIGQEVTITAPFGKFTLGDSGKPYLFLSGGIGITPFRSMLKAATDQKLPHNITLLYSNKTPEDIVFKEDLDVIGKASQNITIVHTMTDSSHPGEPPSGGDSRIPKGFWTSQNDNTHWEQGRIDEAMIRKYVNDIVNTLFYICGPPSMVQGLQSLVASMNVPQENITIELFTGYK